MRMIHLPPFVLLWLSYLCLIAVFTESRPDVPLLLALYEAVHLNRNFVLALTTSHASSVGSGTIPTGEEELSTPAIPRASDGE